VPVSLAPLRRLASTRIWYIAEQTDRAFAQRMSRDLTDRNYVVVGTEYKPDAETVNRTEVRYYKQADADVAEKIAVTLRQAGARGAHPVYLRRYEYSTAVRPRVFEVWFPPNVARGAAATAK
jgi:hypothetical protein